MRKNILLFLSLLWLTLHAWSASATTWNPGKVLLRNGTELQGEVSFNWKAQIVQYRKENQIKAYSTDQVSNFVYFDNQQNNLHKFVAIEHCDLFQHGRPQFLEEIASGTLMVYRGLHLNRDFVKAQDFDVDGKLTKNINAFTYVVFTDNKWLTLNDFYASRWPELVLPYEDQIKHYTKVLGRESKTLVGRMILICKYNALIARAITSGSASDESLITTDLAYDD
ncbi:hypothetical protein GCM10028805_29250 [Spirosoma harenae]